MLICETERLRVSHFSLEDAAFIVRLLNEPSFIRNISDKHVRTLDDARAYLHSGSLASYEHLGFGLSRVALKESGEVIGMCGLFRREGLDDVALGYALLPEYCGKGFAREAVRGVLASDARHHGLRRVVALVSPGNTGSMRVLERTGFQFEAMVLLPGENETLRKFSQVLPPCVRLTREYAQAYRELMLGAYAAHPDAFTSSVTERQALPLSWWEERLTGAPDAKEVVIGVFRLGDLAGVVGLGREPREKARHKATLFGMFVLPQFQQAGLGQLLVEAALAHARTCPGLRQVLLTVTQGNSRAQALYERCGFQTFGVEPDAVALGTDFVDKVHMLCRL